MASKKLTRTGMACLFLLLSGMAMGQKKAIPFQPSNWQFDTARAAFVQYLGVPAVQGKNGRPLQVFLKDKTFTSGTIEFDVALNGIGFPGINFRESDDHKNSENFYLRCFGDFGPLTRTILQYAPVIDGLSMWDLTDEYQGGAQILPTGWNHVKLVVSGRQMKAYVNDMQRPALVVPQLESSRATGGISFSGSVIYANLTIDEGATEGLPPGPGFDAVYNDTRYLRHWQYTAPIALPPGREPVIKVPSSFAATLKDDVPDSSTIWKPVEAGPRAMVNLNTLFGTAPKGEERRFCWLKTTIHSDSTEDRMLSFGFSDEVWVLINGELLYADKNCFGTPSQKEPLGRTTIENAHFKLPLKKGDNELLVGLANYFYGWGLIARLDVNSGLRY